MEIVGDKISYDTAGNIAIYPLNTIKKMNRLKKAIGFMHNYIFTVSSNQREKLPIPSPLSLDNYLKYFVDLNGEINDADMIKMMGLLSPKKYAA